MIFHWLLLVSFIECSPVPWIPQNETLRINLAAGTDNRFAYDLFSLDGEAPFAEIPYGNWRVKLLTVYDSSSSEFWAPGEKAFLFVRDYMSRAAHKYFGTSKNYIDGINMTDAQVQQARYNPDKSWISTAKGNEFNITNVDGTIALGSWYTDYFSLGNTTYFEIPIGMAELANVQHGSAGLSPGVPGSNGSSLLLTLESKGVIQKKSYGFHANSKVGKGRIVFGGVDKDAFIGKMNFLSAVQDTRGFLTLQGFEYRHENLLTAVDNNIKILIDTSSPYINLPPSYKANYSVTDGFVVGQCNRSSNIELLIAGLPFSIPSTSLIKQKLNATLDTCQYALKFGSESDLVVLGMPFLLQAYVYFDNQESIIGLANATTIEHSGLYQRNFYLPGNGDTIGEGRVKENLQ